MGGPSPRAAASTPRLLLWDLDGTLVDSRADIAASANHALSCLGLPTLPLAQVITFVGDGLAPLIDRLLGKERAAQHHQACTAHFTAHYTQHLLDATQPYAGIVACLRAASVRGIRHAVATNKPQAFADAIISGLGLDDCFATVRGGEHGKKPAPTMLLDIMADLAVQPHDTVMIGDHYADLAAAQAAGCAAWYATWGFGDPRGLPRARDLASPADVLVPLGVQGAQA